MKTLIFNGSPRLGGDTASLLELLTARLGGEVVRVDAYRAGIAPCVDCRYCKTHDGCAIDDAMRPIYDCIRECDNVLIASPIYFSELTGPLLSVASRLQRFFCARFFRHETPIEKPKKGAILLVGGGDGSPDRAVATATTLLHQMNCRDILPPVVSHATERLSAIEDENAVEGTLKIVEFFEN